MASERIERKGESFTASPALAALSAFVTESEQRDWSVMAGVAFHRWDGAGEGCPKGEANKLGVNARAKLRKAMPDVLPVIGPAKSPRRAWMRSKVALWVGKLQKP